MKYSRILILLLCLVGMSSVSAVPTGKVVVPATTGNGYTHLQYNPSLVPNHTHFGVDIMASCGKPIYPLTTGEVVRIANEPTSLGHAIMLRHEKLGRNGGDLYTIYLHMESPPKVGNTTLSVGDTVYGGVAMGKIGKTGFADGCHTHFEMRNFFYPNTGTNVGGGGWFHPNSKRCSDQSLNIYSCGDQRNTSWALSDWENPATYQYLCNYGNTTCRMSRLGSIAWYPAVNDCTKASQWFYVENQDPIVLRIGPVTKSQCSQCPAN